MIEEHGELNVRLPAKGYGTTEFDMSEARRNAPVESARLAPHGATQRAAHELRPGGPATKASRRSDSIALDLLD